MSEVLERSHALSTEPDFYMPAEATKSLYVHKQYRSVHNLQTAVVLPRVAVETGVDSFNDSARMRALALVPADAKWLNEGKGVIAQAYLPTITGDNWIESVKRHLSNLRFILYFNAGVLKMQNENSIDETVDFIFDCIEDRLLNDERELINGLLGDFTELDQYIDEVLLAILTITYSWRTVLPFRKAFFERVDVYFRKNYSTEEAESLLAGLE